MNAMSALTAPAGGCAAVGLASSRPRAATAAVARPTSLRVCSAASPHGSGKKLECRLCRLSFATEAERLSHLNTRRHIEAAWRRAEAPEFAVRANTSLSSLETMNEWLKRFGCAEVETVEEARDELSKIHINIYDLVENRFSPVFKTVSQLSKYSVEEGKIFPLKAAKDSHLALRMFLRQLF